MNKLILLSLILLISCTKPVDIKPVEKPAISLEYGFRCGYKATIEGVEQEVCYLTKKDQVALETWIAVFCD